MTKAKGSVDKNLSNVADALSIDAVNGHQAQQLQQDKNDRRNQDAINHDHPTDLLHQKD
ncbi:hypothetical protein MHI37_00495 [Paenibacillus sp. FSL H8-0548]|uniref:hypothetical protein n=1 Tax=Paenibacillus sp. FSL H8-0548 TaxID=1920422 RepID=UPI0015C31029|nr:hypothetical protein [Paenibacillus sp. FSL H8-0548]